MNAADIVGALLQGGMANQSGQRMQNTVQSGGVGDILGQLLGGGAGAAGGAGGGGMGSLAQIAGALLGGSGGAGQPAGAGGGGMGGLAQIAGALLGGGAGQGQAGGMPGAGGGGMGGLAQIAGALLGGGQGQAGGMPGGAAGAGGGMGGLAQMAGALLGGGQQGGMGANAMGGSAVGGGGMGGGGMMGGGLGGLAMGVLGSLAASAMSGKSGAQAATPVALPPQDPETVEETSSLVLRAMINATKADGQIDQQELDRILGKLGEAGADKSVQDYLRQQFKAPIETNAIVADVTDDQTAAQVYAASLFAIDVDTQAEVDYLQELATGLGLAPQVVQRIHSMVGVRTA